MLNNLNKHTVSDEIGDCYQRWEKGDIVSISGGTGSGKSYFVRNVLAAYAKKHNELILYLVPRVKLKEQIEAILVEEEITNITVKMYQSIEGICKSHGDNNEWLSAYKYVVCDESHYFLGDSQFNDYTDMSLTHVLSATNTITLLLSATGETILSYIEKFYKERKIIRYSVEHDYSYIQKISAYQSDEYLFEAMDWLLKNNHKSLVFIQSAKKAYELFRKYEQYATFVCGEQSEYHKFVDKCKVDTIINSSTFDSLFLIATSVLDVGVDIKDDGINHIIIDMLDTDTFIQCLGRKRLSRVIEEKINLLFKNYTNQQINGYISVEAERVETGKLFYGASIESDYKVKRRRRMSGIFYMDASGEVKVNNMKYIKSAINLRRYRRYVQQPQGFINEIASLLNYPNKVYILDFLQDRKEKLSILEKYVDVDFYSSSEAKVVLKELKLKNPSTKKVVKDFAVANRILSDEGYPFEFINNKAYVTDSNGKKQTRIYTLIGIETK
ncbi:hypothetical protein [Sporosarcina koreensis]|uniref:Helicase ATP-binding domain-containing protein n=1 Tax=Sporosarcina koreensis TaxID=334735 RepID=A0ABW0TWP2_9BACL